jgi:WD40 repeat protein
VRTDRFGDPLPQDALVRLGVARFRAEGSVSSSFFLSGSSVAFSPDGKWLAGADSDGLVYLWEVATGKVIQQLDAGKHSNTVFFSQDGKLLGTRAATGESRLWAIASGKLQTTYRRRAEESHHDQIVLSPGRTRLIVVDDGNQLIDVRNGKYADSQVIGKKLPELSIELLELPSGKLVKELARNAPETVFSDAALSPDGRLLAVGIRAYKAPRKLLRLIDATSGEVVREITGEGEGWFLSVAFSHDGKTLALGSKDEIVLADVATGKLVDRLTDKMSTVGFLGFSPDAKTLVSHSHDDKVRLWDLATRKAMRAFEAKCEGHFVFPLPTGSRAPSHSELFGRANGTALSPDGKTVAVSAACRVQLWDVGTGKKVFPEQTSADGCNQLAFSPDGRLLLVGTWKQPHLWDSVTGDVRKELPVPADHATFSPNGKYLAFGHHPEEKDPAALIWDIAAGKELFRLGHPRKEGFGFQKLAFGPDGRTLLTLSTHEGNEGSREAAVVHRWDTRTGKLLGSIHREDTHAWGSVIAADGRTAAIGLSPGLLLTDVENDEDLWTREDGTPEGWSGYPVFSPDAGFLFAWSRDGYVALWEIATRSTIARLGMNRDGNTRLARWPYWDKEARKEPEVPLDQSAIAALAVSPDGRLVATSEHFDRRYHASSTKPVPWPVIRIWEAATGKEVQRLEGFRSLSFNLAFSPDGRRLASAFCNDTVLVWDVRRAAHPEGAGNKPTQEVMDRLWGDLALADGARAYSAITAFQESPEEATTFLARRVRPVPAAEAARVQQLIRSLDSELFMEREASARELKALTARFRATLRKALKDPASLEVKRRLEAILIEAPRQLPLELLRTVRCIQTLERIGSAEARRVLGVLAKGAADAHETRAARMALDRLTMRSTGAPGPDPQVP